MPHFLKLHAITICASLTLVLVAAAPIWTGNHYALNLEPYPDGLFYLTQAQNLASGKGLTVDRPGLDTQPLSARILPAYPVMLAPLRTLGLPVSSFYALNTLLAIGTVVILEHTLRKLGITPMSRAVALAAYVSHASLYFLIATPMAENLALFFVAGCLHALAHIYQKSTLSIAHQLWLGLLLCGLLLTKYTVIPLSATVWLIIVLQLWSHKRLTQSVIPSIGALIGLSGVAAFYVAQRHSSHELAHFFSIDGAARTLLTYMLSLTGGSIPLLWHRVALSALGLTAYWYWCCPGARPLKWETAAMFLAHFPLIVGFTTTDGRYLLTMLPMIAVIVGLLHQHYHADKHTRKVMTLVLVVLAATQLGTQAQLFKTVIASNWLGRSMAWQYEAVRVIAQSIQPTADAYVITALPPYLFDLYGYQNVHLLALSPHQEFADKNQEAWAGFQATKPYVQQYSQLLQDGKRVYVSNAYLSSNHLQQADFDQISKNFTLIKRAIGCIHTCDLWELQQ